MLAKPSILAALLLFAAAPSAAAQMPKDESPAANVRQSRQYDELLRTNPGFRARRIAEECGPIADQQLHAECVASFGGGAPPPHPMHHGKGS
jgi:hypothetical protein